MSHFPAHMRAEFKDQKHLYERFGDRQGIASTINIAMVVCDASMVDAVFATIKNVVLLSISPVHLLLFTQDEVMKKLILIILLVVLGGCSSVDNRERQSRNSGDIYWNEKLVFMLNGYRSIMRDDRGN